jgi:hypothetical protein
MKPNDTYETAELFSDADFKIYLKYGWILLDVKKGDDSCPVIYVVGKVKKENNTLTENNTEILGGQ